MADEIEDLNELMDLNRQLEQRIREIMQIEAGYLKARGQPRGLRCRLAVRQKAMTAAAVLEKSSN